MKNIPTTDLQNILTYTMHYLDLKIFQSHQKKTHLSSPGTFRISKLENILNLSEKLHVLFCFASFVKFLNYDW